MIVGIGFDLAALARISKAEERFGDHFLHRVLSQKEREDLPQNSTARSAYIAGRWAAKEAVMKALGTGFSVGISFHDAEILRSPSGRPEIFLHGKAKEAAEKQGVRYIHVSISHEREMAGAVVILEN